MRLVFHRLENYTARPVAHFRAEKVSHAYFRSRDFFIRPVINQLSTGLCLITAMHNWAALVDAACTMSELINLPGFLKKPGSKPKTRNQHHEDCNYRCVR